MDLKRYLDLAALLEKDSSTPSERRAFGLKHSDKKHDPVAQLCIWIEARRHKLVPPLMSEKVDLFLYRVTVILVAAAFVLGLFSGAGLLSYSGKEPVNLIYFLAMVVLLPLSTMLLSVAAMLRADRTKNLLVHISPAYWMEWLFSLVGRKREETDDLFTISPSVLNWIVIRRSQMLALAFSSGLLVALLGVVATRDIAFAWSTTLDLSDTAFHAFLKTVALPWRVWLPSAVPSLELVSQSHYFRLGGALSGSMVSHAALLGTWWKFLAMATLFYAVLLRVIFLLIATIGYKRALQRAMLRLDGADMLLREMNQPLVTTQATETENAYRQVESGYKRVLHTLKDSYDIAQGWAIPKARLSVICDSLGVAASGYYEVGGNNPLEEDRRIADLSHGDVALFVKAWEPPTMDFVDYLLMLAAHADSVVIIPVGTEKSALKASDKEIGVWIRKIAALDQKKVWIKQ